MNLKPLNQDEFSMKIIEDLGMLYPTENSKKKSRYAIFECKCGKHFKACVNSVKRGIHKTCSVECGSNLIKIEKLSQDFLKKIFYYNPKTGIFTRLQKTALRQKIGETVGVEMKNGYLKCGIGSKEYTLHRLAWLYMYGKMPNGQIDHINHIRSDNRISNLRVVDSVENLRNMSKSKRNKSGIVGVFYDKERELWKSHIMYNGKSYTKRFNTKFGAIRQRVLWNREFNFHENHGK